MPPPTRSLIRRPAAFLWLAPLAWLWFVLINDLRVEWTVNPQYSYGWAVPFLCAFLIYTKVESRKQKAESAEHLAPSLSLQRSEGCQLPASSFQLLLVLLALLYAPTRLIEVANPGWRLVSWALALEVVGITLCLLRLAQSAFPLRLVRGEGQGEVSSPFSTSQRFRFADFVFPVGFFLVAVPWPSYLEMALIQGLTRADTAATTELLGWLGIPAMPHGNVIEVATGMVGIDEACSGIRSFQATLMISLFLGEFYALGAWRRWFCVFAGFGLALIFNLARMSFLVWVAARQGVAAIASWHDPAGVTILVACFFSLWALGAFLSKAEKRKTKKLKAAGAERQAPGAVSQAPGASGFQVSGFGISAFQLKVFPTALIAWIVLTEAGVETWYRLHEARVPAATQWTIAWPVNNPAFKELPLPERTRQILRYDEGRSAAWPEGDLTWQAVFLRWKPGRTAIHLAQNHTPEVCMTAAGYTLNPLSPQEWIEVNGLRLPFLAYQVTDAPRPVFVFYCLWDDRARAQGFQTESLTYGNRLAPVLAGLRNPGQRSLEITVAGPATAAEAEADLRAELSKLITLK